MLSRLFVFDHFDLDLAENQLVDVGGNQVVLDIQQDEGGDGRRPKGQ